MLHIAWKALELKALAAKVLLHEHHNGVVVCATTGGNRNALIYNELISLIRFFETVLPLNMVRFHLVSFLLSPIFSQISNSFAKIRQRKFF